MGIRRTISATAYSAGTRIELCGPFVRPQSSVIEMQGAGHYRFETHADETEREILGLRPRLNLCAWATIRPEFCVVVSGFSHGQIRRDSEVEPIDCQSTDRGPSRRSAADPFPAEEEETRVPEASVRVGSALWFAVGLVSPRLPVRVRCRIAGSWPRLPAPLLQG